MGQSSSNNSRPTGLQHNRQIQSPHRSSRSRPQSPSSASTSQATSPVPHRSLRTKKKSLELPDLASLGLSAVGSQSSQGPYGRRQLNQPHISDPIPIPLSPDTLPNPYGTPPRGRKRQNFQSTQQIPDELEPSTHIPIVPVNDSNKRRGGNPYGQGAQIPYNSTRSLTNRNKASSQRMKEPQRPPSPAFVPETVHSTIPIALFKAEQELTRAEFGDVDDEHDGDQVHDLALQKEIAADEPKEPIPTKIYWKGGGRKVALARAADNNWKGRHAMEPDQPPATKIWSTTLPLLPGTHHIKFIVDDMWRVAESMPTAVDDEGSLTNYIVVNVTGPTPPSSHPVSPAPKLLHQQLHQAPGQSFWSTTSSTAENEPPSLIMTKSGSRGKINPPKWTDEFPPELIAAAGEEESYLASSSSASDSQSTLGVAAPNIPPAPVLPRHLDKLILNAKKEEVRTGGRAAMREKEREERRSGRKARSLLGMTSTTATATTITTSPTEATTVDGIPVTTPNGIDVRTGVNKPATKRSLDFQGGVVDDASVLPVPSHVVLHHLSTSAIRNGVLAVANTTRYKKKYLTTIYYKPT